MPRAVQPDENTHTHVSDFIRIYLYKIYESLLIPCCFFFLKADHDHILFSITHCTLQEVYKTSCEYEDEVSVTLFQPNEPFVLAIETPQHGCASIQALFHCLRQIYYIQAHMMFT